MTREEALKKTREKFTNLLDGTVLPSATVTSIINYYETLVEKNVAPVVKHSSGILDNFMEEEIKEYEEQQEDNY